MSDQAAAGADPGDDQHKQPAHRPPTEGESRNQLARIVLANGVLDDPKKARRLWFVLYGRELIADLPRLIVSLAAVCTPTAVLVQASGIELTRTRILTFGSSILASTAVVFSLLLLWKRRRNRLLRQGTATSDRDGGGSRETSKPRSARRRKRRKPSRRRR